MYARVTNTIAQNEMQLTMWIETFKNIGSKKITDAGAIQITITKIAPNKAILMSVYPNANYLSMGTTSDFESAIQFGSNLIRVGELIFGKRL